VSEQPGTPNETARIEAFSDGVFAIAITLLILEIRVPPQTPDGVLRDALGDLWPSYVAFLASFMTIGVMWLNHHRLFSLINKKDDGLIAFNLLLLLGITWLPFPTALLAEHLLGPHVDQQAAAIIVAADPLTVANGRAIIDECISMKLPAMHTYAFETKNGALMSYGIDLVENYRRTAEYIDRILKGIKIADLPFQEPTRLTLAINLQTARAIGIKVPSTLLARADEVIE